MRTLVLGLLWLLPVISRAHPLPFKALNANALRYEISPVFVENVLRLNIRLTFRGSPEGLTEVLTPAVFGAAEKLYRCVQGLQCSNARLSWSADSTQIRLEHAPEQELVVRYTLVQDFPGENVAAQNGFRPILQNSYFHVLGPALFLTPKLPGGYDVTLEWRGFPKSWVIHNSWGSRQAIQKIRAMDLKWQEAVFVGGDFRILQTAVQGKPVYLAIRGTDWNFADTSLLRLLRETVAIQRRFWQDFDIPYYTVTLLPLASPPQAADGGFYSIQYLGAGLTNSFAAYATPVRALTVNELKHLFHHELMHDWIGGKIRNGGSTNDMQFGWFSEGFTEYFAYKNILIAGLLSTDEYVDIVNEQFFKTLYASPVAEAPNSVITADFFNRQDVQDLAYKRGFVFAFYLDNAIKVNSKGARNLHGLMLELLDYYYENDHTLLTHFDFFLKNGSKYLGRDLTPLYQTHILDGQLIPVEDFMLPEGIELGKNRYGWPALEVSDVAGAQLKK